MKNIFSKAAIAAFFITGTLSAQSSMEIHDVFGNTVDGDTLNYYVPVNGTHYTDFHQYNITNSSVTYKVQKTQVTMTATSSAWFCVYHNSDANDPQSQCYIPSTMNSGDFVTDTGAHNLLLADFAAGANPGISIVKYKFYDKFNTADSSVITLIYNVTPVGVQENTAASITGMYPNPAAENTTILFSNLHNENATIQITDVAGRVVFSQSMKGSNGSFTVPCSEWESGLYMVSVLCEDRITSVQRLIVH